MKPSASSPATCTRSPSTHLHTSLLLIFHTPCTSLYRFLISSHTTYTRSAPPERRRGERVGNTNLPGTPRAAPCPNYPSAKGNTGQAWSGVGLLQWRPALLVRLGATSCRRSCRRPGKLAASPQRTGILAQRTAGKFLPHWRSRTDRYGPRRQSRRVGSGREGYGRESDRERRLRWSYSDRDPRPGGGASRRTRPRHRRFTETTLDTVRWPTGWGRAAHSCAAPARSDVRSAPERSQISTTSRWA